MKLCVNCSLNNNESMFSFISYHFFINLQKNTIPSSPRFTAVISSYRLLQHGVNVNSVDVDIRDCLQADGTHKTNLHGFPALIVGVCLSDFPSFNLI